MYTHRIHCDCKGLQKKARKNPNTREKREPDQDGRQPVDLELLGGQLVLPATGAVVLLPVPQLLLLGEGLQAVVHADRLHLLLARPLHAWVVHVHLRPFGEGGPFASSLQLGP